MEKQFTWHRCSKCKISFRGLGKWAGELGHRCSDGEDTVLEKVKTPPAGDRQALVGDQVDEP